MTRSTAPLPRRMQRVNLSLRTVTPSSISWEMLLVAWRFLFASRNPGRLNQVRSTGEREHESMLCSFVVNRICCWRKDLNEHER